MRGTLLCEVVREAGLSRGGGRVLISQRSGGRACQEEGGSSCKWAWHE